MAKTLLDCVNQVLVRVGNIHGDSGLLTTLVSSARQRSVDVAIQVVNEGIDELYTTAELPLPKEQAESSISLVSGTRSYTLATDLVQMRWPLIDKTNTQFIDRFPGDYNDILEFDPEQNDTGLPTYAAISPVDGNLYLDRIPTSVEDGRIYTYQYDKDLVLSIQTDTVPFKDIVFRAMIPAWANLWRRDMQNEFDADLFTLNIGRACRVLSQEQPRTDYSPRG